jgi:hypothetical protein
MENPFDVREHEGTNLYGMILERVRGELQFDDDDEPEEVPLKSVKKVRSVKSKKE